MTRWVDGTAVLAWNLCAWVIWGAAAVRVVRTPAERSISWWRTKVGRLAVNGLVSLSVGGLFLPFGGAVVVTRMRGKNHLQHNGSCSRAVSDELKNWAYGSEDVLRERVS